MLHCNVPWKPVLATDDHLRLHQLSAALLLEL